MRKTHIIFLLILVCSSFAGILAIQISQFQNEIDKTLQKRTYTEHLHSKNTTTIFDRYGKHVISIGSDKNDLIPIKALRSHTIYAFLAAEDKDFYHHKGINLSAMIRALWVNLKASSYQQGASTISQQVARILFLSPKKTILRKIREVLIAIALEKHWTKDKILQFYLNHVYFGHRSYGIQSASRRYFSKSAKDLNLAESALLASLLKAPSYLAPNKHLKRAKESQKKVLKLMLKDKLVSLESYKKALTTPITIVKPKQSPHDIAGYFLDQLLKSLSHFSELPQQGRFGFQVHSTLDLDMQVHAVKAIKKISSRFTKQVQASLLTMDIYTGEIISLVGGRSYKENKFNRAFYSKRPIGNLVQPIIISLAINQGHHLLSPISNNFLIKTSPKTLYHTFLSFNSQLTKPLILKTGIDNFREYIDQLGLHHRSTKLNDPNLITATPLRLSLAFSALYNGGLKISPKLYRSVHQQNRLVLQNPLGGSNMRLISADSSFMMRYLTKSLKTLDQAPKKRANMAQNTDNLTGFKSFADTTKNLWLCIEDKGLIHTLWLGSESGLTNAFQDKERSMNLAINYMADYVKFSRRKQTPAPKGLRPNIAFKRVQLRGYDKNRETHTIPFRLHYRIQ